MKEYHCKCGQEIPRGYGYTLGHSVRCLACGRINQRSLNLKDQKQ